jgi:hypothetical protein
MKEKPEKRKPEEILKIMLSTSLPKKKKKAKKK